MFLLFKINQKFTIMHFILTRRARPPARYLFQADQIQHKDILLKPPGIQGYLPQKYHTKTNISDALQVHIVGQCVQARRRRGVFTPS